MKAEMAREIRARFLHYAPRNGAEVETHENIRHVFRTAALSLVENLPEEVLKTREFSQVLTDLENGMMHANAAYARHKPEIEPRTAKGSLD